MKKFRWQIIIAVLALAAVALLLLEQSQVGDTITQLIEPATGGVYVEGVVGEPIRFNPLLDKYNQPDQDIDRLVFSRLIRFDSWGNPQPELAESFGVAVTGDIFNIVMRENAVWHDGTPVTTADVLFTIDLMRNAEMPVSADLVNLWNSVEVVAFDALHLQFRLSEPYAPFIDYLSFGILPKHIFEGMSPQEIINDPTNLLPVGSGPYMVDELLTDNGQVTGVVLKSFEDYYMGEPYIEQVVIRYFDTSEAAFEAYQRGEILGISNVSPELLDQVLAEPDLNIFSVRVPEMTMVLFNLGESGPPFLQNSSLRQAMLMAINRPWMVDKALDGQAIISHSPIMVGSWAYFDNVEKYDYSPEEAIKLLRAQGFGLPEEGSLVREKDGERLIFDLIYPDTTFHTQIAEMIRVYWAGIGIQANLVAVPENQITSDYLATHNYDVALVDLDLSDTPDPDPYQFWHQAMIQDGQNYTQWDDQRASEYLEGARITPNQFERTRLYKSFQIHFSRELPALPLFCSVYNYAISNQVVGVQVGAVSNPSDRFDQIYSWSLESSNVVEDAQVTTGTPAGE